MYFILNKTESDSFQEFHVYVCGALLKKYSTELQGMDFGEILMFLQNLQSQDWNERDVELLLSEAFMLKSLFHGSKAHLKQHQNSE